MAAEIRVQCSSCGSIGKTSEQQLAGGITCPKCKQMNSFKIIPENASAKPSTVLKSKHLAQRAPCPVCQRGVLSYETCYRFGLLGLVAGAIITIGGAGSIIMGVYDMTQITKQSQQFAAFHSMMSISLIFSGLITMWLGTLAAGKRADLVCDGCHALFPARYNKDFAAM